MNTLLYLTPFSRKRKHSAFYQYIFNLLLNIDTISRKLEPSKLPSSVPLNINGTLSPLSRMVDMTHQYKYGYAALSPFDGTLISFFRPYANIECMNVFLEHISVSNPKKNIFMFVDQASFHSFKDLKTPLNIRLFPILARSAELNPVEVLWKYIRSHFFFNNEIFDSIGDVVD